MCQILLYYKNMKSLILKKMKFKKSFLATINVAKSDQLFFSGAL